MNAGPGAGLTLRNLTMAYLIGADLTGAYAYSANLGDAELSQSNLTNVHLGACPSDPNISGWDGAVLAGANLALGSPVAVFDKMPILCNGLRRPSEEL